MKNEYISFLSKNLNRDMSIRIYGNGGTPILVFPTQDAMSDNFENFGMIETLKNFLDSKQIQLFCVDTVDFESWSNSYPNRAEKPLALDMGMKGAVFF